MGPAWSSGPWSRAAWPASTAGANPKLENPRGDTFQDYYFSFPANILNDRARSERKQIIEWLESHDIEVVADADQFR